MDDEYYAFLSEVEGEAVYVRLEDGEIVIDEYDWYPADD